MFSIPALTMNSNKNYKINFDGGQLSSDGGLLLIKEFFHKIGFEKLINRSFMISDSDSRRKHTDSENLLQMIYQTMGAYFRDDRADDLSHDPVITAALGKDKLASQPTMSRFVNRLDKSTLLQMNGLTRTIRQVFYSLEKPKEFLLDLDSTLLHTFGNQEGQGFNFHYQGYGYHPLVCYDGHTGTLLKAGLRRGNAHSGKESDAFMRELLEELKADFPKTPCVLRADSGFATPKLYKVLEEFDCSYAIRQKINSKLKRLVADEAEALNLRRAESGYTSKDHFVYGEMMYRAGKWDRPRRIVYKIEGIPDSFLIAYTFIITSMDDKTPEEIIDFYHNRGSMENFIKEGKNGFGFRMVSSSKMIANENRLQIHALTYNLFNAFRRLVLTKEMRKHHIDTIRIMLFKIAVKMVHRSRQTYFKLCSSFAYKREFIEIFKNIEKLSTQLE